MGLELVVKLLADSSGLVKGTAEGGKSIEAFGKSIDIGGVAKVAAFAGAAGIAVTAIAGMTQAAAADRAEQEKLNAIIATATGTTDDYNAVIDEAIAKGQDRAFSDSETRDALASLVTATGDVSAATEWLSSAQNLARMSNVDLATAADAYSKAIAGNSNALVKLVPGMEKSESSVQNMITVTKLAKGQADLFANSAEGMGMRSSDALGELSETIGSVFLPVLDAILPALLPVIKALGSMITAVLPILIPLLKTVGAVLAIVATAIAKVAEALATLITWVTKAIAKIGDLVAKLGPLKSVAGVVGGIIGKSAPAAASAGARSLGVQSLGAAGWSSGGGSAVTINAFGDPATIELAVVRGLRRYDRRNGADQVVPRWS